ncbi:hypothetical protein B0J12DRAFT_613008, partial [Macrophomina phaseolina]
MPRRSVRRSAGSAASAASKRPSSPQPAPKRQSKRAKVAGSSKATPAKSQYFEQEQEPASAHDSSGADDAAGKEESGYEDEDATGTGSSSDSDAAADDDAYSSDDRSASRKRGRPQKPARVTKTAVAGKKGKELWRTGVDTGLEPGTKLVIKKPKPREAGATPYTDDTIHPNTLLFLQDLAKNNDREWLKMHDPDYRTSLKDFNSFVEKLTEKVIEADDTIPELPIKDIVFRIYRDIRFSSDPTPYKTHFSAAWSRTGRKGPYAAYYVHLQPNASFVVTGTTPSFLHRSVSACESPLLTGRIWQQGAESLDSAAIASAASSALAVAQNPAPDSNNTAIRLDARCLMRGGGLWMPAADSLQKLRRDIDRKPHKIKSVLTDARLRKEFFDGVPNDEKKAVEAFTKHNAESALKTRPQGYAKDHCDIELLRLRSFTISSKLDDSEVMGAGGLQRVADLISCMVPFSSAVDTSPLEQWLTLRCMQITYLNSVVMPDAPSSGEDDSSNESSAEE